MIQTHMSMTRWQWTVWQTVLLSSTVGWMTKEGAPKRECTKRPRAPAANRACSIYSQLSLHYIRMHAKPEGKPFVLIFKWRFPDSNLYSCFSWQGRGPGRPTVQRRWALLFTVRCSMLANWVAAQCSALRAVPLNKSICRVIHICNPGHVISSPSSWDEKASLRVSSFFSKKKEERKKWFYGGN